MPNAITTQMLQLWRRLLEIMDAGDDEFWEHEGGKRREFLELKSRLDELLGLAPNQRNPIDAIAAVPPAWMTKVWRREDYARAHKLARLFEAADRAARRRARPRSPARDEAAE